MTLIVAPEGPVYCDVAHADAYHLARNNTAWAALATEAKEAAIIQATDYMGIYAGRWSGSRADASQVLDWPRVGAVAFGFDIAADAVPDAVRNACAALALRASTASLAPDIGPQKVETTIGPITTKYAVGTRESKQYREVEIMLEPFFGGIDAHNVKLVRA